jgi:hypothetical protein
MEFRVTYWTPPMEGRLFVCFLAKNKQIKKAGLYGHGMPCPYEKHRAFPYAYT